MTRNTPASNRAAQRAYRERQKAAGLSELRLHIPPEVNVWLDYYANEHHSSRSELAAWMLTLAAKQFVPIPEPQARNPKD